MKKYRKYLWLLLLLLLSLSIALGLYLNNNSEESDYVNVIPETLNVKEGDVFDLAIDSNLDSNVLNIVISDLTTVRLEGRQLRALSGGTTFITVQSQDGKVQDQVLITVDPLPPLEPVEDDSFEIIVGDERYTFNAPVTISQLETPVREGFTFVGFSLVENGDVLENDTVIDESLTLYSIYQAVEDEVLTPPSGDEDETESDDNPGEESEDSDDADDETDDTSSPSSITVTLENDQGVTMDILMVSPGSLVRAEDFDSELSDVGYFIKGEICANPFDFNTPLITHTSIVFGELNFTSPCIDLDEMATTGNLQVGETIQAFVSPSAATVTYEWFISENDQDYSALVNVTGSTLELIPDHFRKYIAVKLTGTGDYTGSLSLPLGRVGFGNHTLSEPKKMIIDLYSWEDLANIPTGPSSEGVTYQLLNSLTPGSIGYNEFASASANGGQGWIPIGNSESPFMGSFNGNGFTIKGLNISQSGIYTGLFGQVEGDGIYSDVILENFIISGSSQLGVLMGGNSINDINLVISGVSISGGSVKGINVVGGMIGQFRAPNQLSTLTINHSTQSAFVEAKGLSGYAAVGGLVGFSEGTLLVNSTLQSGQISSNGINTGGFFGLLSGEANISASSVQGPIHSTLGNVGGFIGLINESVLSISNSGFHHQLTSSGDHGGGIIGNASSASIQLSNVYVNGSILGSSYVGGLIGRSESSELLELSHVTNSAVILSLSSSYLGGLVGWSDGPLTISNAHNEGIISGSGVQIGGLIGYQKGALKVINSQSVGDINAVTQAGGFVGYLEDADNVTLLGLEFSATLTALGTNLGGLIGYAQDVQIASVHNSTLSGLITGSGSNLGGAFGTIHRGGTWTLQNVRQTTHVNGFDNTGGIIGFASESDIKMVSVLQNGSIEGRFYVGGFIGYVSDAAVELETSSNQASVTAISHVGGFVGHLHSNAPLTAVSITQTGNIVASGNNVGGVFGYVKDSSIYLSSSIQNGLINGNNDVGGLIGYASTSPITIQSVQQLGDVHGAMQVGGLIGRVISTEPNVSLLIKTTIQSGSVHASTQNAAGFVYEIQSSDVQVSNSANIGDVSSPRNAGGLFGSSSNFSWFNINQSYNSGQVSSENSTSSALIGEANNTTLTATSFAYLSTSATQAVGDDASRFTDTAYSIISMTAIETFTGWGINDESNPIWRIDIEEDNFYTYPWLAIQNHPFEAQAHEVDPVIISLIENESYIPIANRSDLENIGGTERVFAAGTLYQTEATGSLSSKYIQVNDINLSGNPLTESLITGEFSGIYNGFHFSLSNLEIDSPSNNQPTGLFETTDGATIKNITLSAFNITGNNQVAGLIGSTSDSNKTLKIENLIVKDSHIYSTLSETSFIIGRLKQSLSLTSVSIFDTSSIKDSNGLGTGGIVGHIQRSNDDPINISISDSHNHARLESTGSKVGGLIGTSFRKSFIQVQNSSNHGQIKGHTNLGGLVGEVNNSSQLQIVKSFNVGDISSDAFGLGGLVGGLNGDDNNNYIINSFSVGTINTTYNANQNLKNQIGGLIGSTSRNILIENSYSNVTINDDNSIGGGIVGDLANKVSISGSVIYNDQGNPFGDESGKCKTENGEPTCISKTEYADKNKFQSFDITAYSETSNSVWVIGYSDENNDSVSTMPWLRWMERPIDEIINP